MALPVRASRAEVSLTGPVKPLFASTPSLAARQRNGGEPEIVALADPTGDYGVGLLRMRYSDATHFSHLIIDQHMIWLHDSNPSVIIARLSGRKTRHGVSRRSINIYPAAVDTVVEACEPGEGILLRVSAECLALAQSQLALQGSTLVERVGRHDDALFRLGQRLEAEAAAGHPNGMLFWSSVADAFIRHLTAHHLSAAAIPPRGAMSRDALKRLLAYIRENLAEPLDLDSLAAVVGCDRFHFAHRFRRTVGMGPHRYVMRLRLDRACERIRDRTGSLAQIAAETGFTDQSHLARWVRRVYNVRPRDLRG